MAEDTKIGSLKSITEGASIYFIGRAVSDALGFLLQLVLTRTLGAGIYGIYAYSKTILNIVLVFTNLGTNASLLKYLPVYQDDSHRQRFILALATMTSLVGALILSTLLFAFAPTISLYTLNEPLFSDVLRLFAVLIVFDTLAKITYSSFRSLEKLEYEALTNKIARPIVRLLAVVIALGLGFSLIGVVASLLAAHLLILLLAAYLLITRFSLYPSFSARSSTKKEVIEYYNFSIPLTLKESGDILIQRADIIMVGFFLSSTAVGIYNISLLLATVVALPLSAFTQIFPPIASRLYSNNEIQMLDSIYKSVTRWIFTVSLILAIGAITYRRELLSLFGDEFTLGTTVLIFFVVAQIFNSLAGPSGYLLMMTDHQYILVINQWTFGVLNIVLNYVLILEYGIIGAAISTGSMLALLNITKVIEVWYLEGLFPYSSSFLNPIVAGVVATIAMFLVSNFLTGILLIAIGGTLGVTLYATCLYLLGIEESDKQLYAEVR